MKKQIVFFTLMSMGLFAAGDPELEKALALSKEEADISSEFENQITKNLKRIEEIIAEGTKLSDETTSLIDNLPAGKRKIFSQYLQNLFESLSNSLKQ